MRKTSFSFFNIALVLTVFGLGGCSAIYSARSFGEDPLYFAFRQLLWLACGVAFFLLLARIPFRLYEKYAVHIGMIGLGLLILVFPFGTTINGMTGWFSIGNLIRIQPSELVKAPFLLLLSVIACNGAKSKKQRFWESFGVGSLFCLLLLLEPDFGTASVFFMGMLLVLYLAGFGYFSLIPLALFAFPCTALFLWRYEYALGRIAGYLNPDAHANGAGWHIKQFQYSMAHGGLWGSDWGGAIWANSYLPLSHTDSAFASIVEACGIAGGFIIIAGFLALALLFRNSALRSRSETARVFLFSVGALCTAQALLHIGVNTALLPPTGLTLPLFSYGGSSLLGTFCAFGIAYSAYRG